VCSANPFVLEAAMRFAAAQGDEVLIEATSNQVNQFGGYSGLTPPAFVHEAEDIAGRMGLPGGRILLGGDHLGPLPWKREDADSAMDKACDLVRAFAHAGFRKLHLDASIPCAGDPSEKHLDVSTVAERTARLCRAAESVVENDHGKALPYYVIGSDVPSAGGTGEASLEARVTTAGEVEESLRAAKRAFFGLGLESAWDRVVAVVVQPGVEFNDSAVLEYDREKTRGISRFIETVPNLVYEAHSTDFQTQSCLRRMVEDHFAILKVGPRLTFAFREAVFALEWMEREWLSSRKGVSVSDLHSIMDLEMLIRPEHWQSFYAGDEAAQAFLRRYGLSDRIRYYWPVPAVRNALDRLIRNLRENPVPLSLMSQFMPDQHRSIKEGRLSSDPVDWIWDKITEVLLQYRAAVMPA
jgi:D-tagatose-1,6-bisphosphate aldolase subunit GatZ/KbaZ